MADSRFLLTGTQAVAFNVLDTTRPELTPYDKAVIRFFRATYSEQSDVERIQKGLDVLDGCLLQPTSIRIICTKLVKLRMLRNVGARTWEVNL